MKDGTESWGSILTAAAIPIMDGKMKQANEEVMKDFMVDFGDAKIMLIELLRWIGRLSKQ
jgi:hypothetical protein